MSNGSVGLPSGPCFSKHILLGESHLRAAVHEYLAYCDQERDHLGLGGQIILPPAHHNQPGPIVCRERLGGLLRFYYHKARLTHGDCDMPH